jgi:hypothetical protein
LGLTAAPTGQDRKWEMTSAAPALPEPDDVDRYITRALAAVRLARLASARSPTEESHRAEELAEWQMNRLLERRLNRPQRTGG